MIGRIVRGIFGTKNGRELKRMGKVVKRINALEEGMQALSDAELAALTPAFRARLDDGESLDKLLPEAFAAVREAAVRAPLLPRAAEQPRPAHSSTGAAAGQGAVSCLVSR